MERPDRDPVDVQDVLGEVDPNWLVPGVVAVGAKLHAAFVDPNEALQRHLVAEPCDHDIAVVGLRRRPDGDHVAVAKPRAVHAVAPHS